MRINEYRANIFIRLLGYTEKDFAILDDKLTGNALKYAKSIMYSNRGNLLKSLKIINQLNSSSFELFD